MNALYSSPVPTLHIAPTTALPASFLHDLRAMVDAAFDGEFNEDDWHHTLGGVHVWLMDGGRVISHGSIVERTLVCSSHRLRAGYVEAVATLAERRGEGHATAVMTQIGGLIREKYALGALSTGARRFYETLGWERWRGPTYVAGARGLERTPDDDGSIMILRTPRSPDLDVDQAIVCEWRAGDVW